MPDSNPIPETSMDDTAPPPEVPAEGADHEAIYVLRTTQQNQVQLNLIADQKANIIIGVSLIFFTITQSQLISLDFSDPWKEAPLLILAVTMIGSFITAVLVVSPKLVSSRNEQDPEKLTNPLFFGSFTSLDEDTYTAYLQERVANNLSSRDLLIRDIHQTGRVLRRKYRILRFAYLFLACGILSTAIELAIYLLAT